MFCMKLNVLTDKQQQTTQTTQTQTLLECVSVVVIVWYTRAVILTNIVIYLKYWLGYQVLLDK